jgi:carbon-monoxide dehydrogenase large subunit
MDYTMPRADDLPSFKLSHTTTLCPGNSARRQGLRRSRRDRLHRPRSSTPSPDAIGNNQLEMPATPDRVWHAIHG